MTETTNQRSTDGHVFVPVPKQTGCATCGFARGHHPTAAQLRQLAKHRAADPHCTCNDCIAHHADQQERADEANDPRPDAAPFVALLDAALAGAIKADDVAMQHAALTAGGGTAQAHLLGRIRHLRSEAQRAIFSLERNLFGEVQASLEDVAHDLARALELVRVCQDAADAKDAALGHGRPVCPNCGQFQHWNAALAINDCVNDCKRRGLAGGFAR